MEHLKCFKERNMPPNELEMQHHHSTNLGLGWPDLGFDSTVSSGLDLGLSSMIYTISTADSDFNQLKKMRKFWLKLKEICFHLKLAWKYFLRRFHMIFLYCLMTRYISFFSCIASFAYFSSFTLSLVALLHLHVSVLSLSLSLSLFN